MLRGLPIALLVSLSLAGCSRDKAPSPAPPPPAPAPGAAAGSQPSAAADTATNPAAGATASPPPAGGAAEQIPLYRDRAWTAAELEGRSLRELSLIRNTVFARAGNQFRKAWLREHFTAQPWYKPLPELDESALSQLDWDNVKRVAEVEANLSAAQLEARKHALLEDIGEGAPTPEQQIELELVSTHLGEWIGQPGEDAPRSPLADPALLDKILTVQQLENMSRRDLRILRNTIYARRGYVFKSDVLESYFYSMDWYDPDSAYTDDRLTKVDWKNIKLVKSVEQSLGGPMTEYEQLEEDGWFAAA